MLAVIMIGLLQACSFKANDQQANRPLIIGEGWQPVPTAMRIYPSTRFAVRDGEQVLDARVELFDQMGDSVKGTGQFSFELLEDIGPMGTGTQLYVWDIEVFTLEAQQKYYDPISRGYLFRLRMDDAEIAKQGGVLQVVFTPLKGDRLDAMQTIKPR
ncbi:hypothetical protein [Poriferisphaera sp. WC338]|uniref:hypothetical protein n=1 Tax=Poriferisphaera sp. WC338 TaxID=3425129 RepID=UPI003D81B0C7